MQLESVANYVLQIKALIATAFVVLGFVYSVKSGILSEILGTWERRYKVAAGERDELKVKLVTQEAIKDAKIKELEDFIKILVLNDKTRMEIEIEGQKQRHA
jgi:hypothetical protein